MIGLRAGGGLGPGGFLRGGVTSSKEGMLGLFNIFSTNRRLEQVELSIAELKRAFHGMEQEWDTTSMRVTKVLRRLRSAEERREREESGDGVAEGADAGVSSPLTTIPTPPDRMTKIRQQLAARKEGA